MNDSNKLKAVRCFLLDMDGTFYLGERLLEGALRFIDLLHSREKEYLFLTNNSSKQGRQYAEKINRLGPPLPEELVLTSGEATALYLKRRQAGARLFVMGTPALEDEFRWHGFQLVDEDRQLIVLGFDQTLTYRKLWRLGDLVREGIPYTATHADFNCPTETGWMPDVGAMIAFVKAALKMGLPIAQLGMIGDRLYADIALGKSSGITTVLVLSGETKIEDVEGSPFKPDDIFQNLGAVADWLERAN